jgi:hypothetical protein
MRTPISIVKAQTIKANSNVFASNDIGSNAIATPLTLALFSAVQHATVERDYKTCSLIIALQLNFAFHFAKLEIRFHFVSLFTSRMAQNINVKRNRKSENI